MPRFYGTIHGDAKTVTSRRCHEIITHAASWAGAIRVRVWLDPHTNIERFNVDMVPWKGAGPSHELASGVVGVDPTVAR